MQQSRLLLIQPTAADKERAKIANANGGRIAISDNDDDDDAVPKMSQRKRRRTRTRRRASLRCNLCSLVQRFMFIKRYVVCNVWEDKCNISYECFGILSFLEVQHILILLDSRSTHGNVDTALLKEATSKPLAGTDS